MQSCHSERSEESGNVSCCIQILRDAQDDTSGDKKKWMPSNDIH